MLFAIVFILIGFFVLIKVSAEKKILLIEAKIGAIENSNSNMSSLFIYEVELSKNKKESISDTEIVRMILHFVYKMFYISDLSEQILIAKFIRDVVKSTQVKTDEYTGELNMYLNETENYLSIIPSLKLDKKSTGISKLITVKYYYLNILNRKITTKLPLTNYKYQFLNSIVAIITVYVKKLSPMQVSFLIASFDTMVQSMEVNGKLNNPDDSFHNRNVQIEIALRSKLNLQ